MAPDSNRALSSPARWPTPPVHTAWRMEEYYVHEYNPNFYMLQAIALHGFTRSPSLYVIFGSERALLWGYRLAQRPHMREAVDQSDRALAEGE